MPFVSSIEATTAFGRNRQSAPVPTTTAVLYYDPSVSSSYSGSGTSLLNIGTGGTMTGTMSSVTYTSSGGGYFTFNGSSSAISFNAFNFGTTLTMSAWIYATNKASINTVVANAAANTNTNGFKIHWNSWNTTNYHMLIEAGNGTTGGASTNGSSVIVPNTWQHLTWVWDVTNRAITFYVNGVSVGSSSGTGPPSNPNMNQAWRIGSMAGAYLMSGRLGYLKVWNTLQTVTQILAEFNATKSRFGL